MPLIQGILNMRVRLALVMALAVVAVGLLTLVGCESSDPMADADHHSPGTDPVAENPAYRDVERARTLNEAPIRDEPIHVEADWGSQEVLMNE